MWHMIWAHSKSYVCKSKSTNDVWLFLRECRNKIYIGHPSEIRSDRGVSVILDLFKDLLEVNGTGLQLSPIEVHKAIDITERYHLPLR